MKYSELNIVEVELTKEELESFREKFGGLWQQGNSILMIFSETYKSEEWWSKLYTFFGGLSGKEDGIYIDCRKSI